MRAGLRADLRGGKPTVTAMENLRAFTFQSARDVNRHLNRWAAETLTGPEEWAAALADCAQWMDYSPRNQVLLASYGARGPVAGRDTWRLVEATDGRACTPRAGERGYPVRIPITRPGREADPYLGGTRPVRAHAEGFEWYPVFSAAQLARPPAPDTLPGVVFPARVADDDGATFHDAVRRAARSLGHPVLEPGSRRRSGLRVPADATPDEASARVLAALAGRGAGMGRSPLTVPEASQVAWLVAARVQRSAGSMPAEFDPSLTEPRERWARLVETVAATRTLIGRVGHSLGVDLLASPLPRHPAVDDRAVRPTARAHLPEASVRGLPVGAWKEVGPYTAAEWANRGVPGGEGRAAYLRVSAGSYLAAVEHGDGLVRWQLESLRARTVTLTGEAPTLTAARQAAVSAAVDARILASAPPVPAVPPAGGMEWTERPRDRTGRALDRAVTADGITLLVLPGAGGRWQPLVLPPLGAPPQALPLEADRATARAAAQAAVPALGSPARLDDQVQALVGGDDYTRAQLVELVAGRLDPRQRAELADPDLSTVQLTDLLAVAGLSGTVITETLAVEHRPVLEVAELLPTLGLTMVPATRALADGWDLPVVDAGRLLGATVEQLRDAGASPAELLAAHPAETLARLAPDPDRWRTAAGDLAAAGATPSVVTAHLLRHAPTVECFVVAMDTVVPGGDFLTAAALAAAHQAPAVALAGLAEWHDVTVDQTAAALAAYAVPTPVAVETLRLACHGHQEAATTAAVTHLGLSPADVHAALAPADTPPRRALTLVPEPSYPSDPDRQPATPNRSRSR